MKRTAKVNKIFGPLGIITPTATLAYQPDAEADVRNFDIKTLSRFWSKVDRSTPDGCWVWNGSLSGRGYGQISVNGRAMKTHRLSWEIHHYPVPDELFVLHTCDNPPCCNPAHLWLGTRADNMRDCGGKGRHWMQANGHTRAGELHPRAKLTDADALQIRAQYVKRSPSCRQLAERFNVSMQTVRGVANGVGWKHLIEKAKL